VQTTTLHSARGGPPRVKGAVAPSSLHNELIPGPEAAPADESVTSIPNVMPLRTSLQKPPFLDQQASDDIAEAIRAAHPRRNNKRLSAGFGEEGGDKKRVPTDQSLLEPRSDRGPKGDVDPTSDALSTIDEGHSDGGCSTQSVTIPAGPTDSKGDTTLAQWVPNPAVTVTSDSITGHQSPSSEHSKQPDTTPGTSILERPEQDDSDMPDMSDDEEDDDDGYNSESASEFTDDTDHSLCKSFAGISLEPKLTCLALTLQDQIIFIVVQRVLNWINSHSPGDDPGDGQPANSSGPVDYYSSQHNGSGSSGQGNGGNSSNKRDFDGRDTGGTGRGNGDDGHKRRRTDAHSQDKVDEDTSKAFACPFAKRYPDKTWPNTCNRGWPKVHRIKYVYNPEAPHA
jgi:hypothetical protein